MTSDKKIQNILNDLYEFDPELKKREKELQKTIADLLKTEPDPEINEDFTRRLKRDLLQEARKRSKGWSFLWNTKKIVVPAGAVILVAVILASAYYLSFGNPSQLARKKDAGGMAVQSLDEKAFGDIGIRARDKKVPGVDGGGQMTRETEEEDMDASVSSPKTSTVAPNSINYEFNYTGKEFQQNQEELKVYKRIKDDSLARKLARQFHNIDLELMDLNRFENRRIRNLSLVEDKKFGYSVDFNFRDNSVRIGKNRQQWPDKAMECRGDSQCLQENRLDKEDMPSRKEIIAIAEDFITGLGLDKSYYGSPEVRDNWKQTYDLSPKKEEFRFPDTVTVVYPLRIDKKSVYKRGGDSDGLHVNVNVRHKKVAGVNDLFLPRFQASEYPAVSQEEKIIDQAEDGGLNPPFRHQNSTRTVEVDLGTPERELVKIWNSSGQGSSEELYVPAYIFPVTGTSEETHFAQKNIIVPLVEGLTPDSQNHSIGIPEKQIE